MLIISTLFSCTPEAKEELNAVNNEVTFQRNVESFMNFTKEFRNENIDVVMDMFACSFEDIHFDKLLKAEVYTNSWVELNEKNLIDAIKNAKWLNE